MPTARICLCQSVILKSKMFYTYQILDSFAHWGEHREKKKVLSYALSPSFFHECFRNYTVVSLGATLWQDSVHQELLVLSQHATGVAAAAPTACCCWLVGWLQVDCWCNRSSLHHVRRIQNVISHTIIFQEQYSLESNKNVAGATASYCAPFCFC